MSRFVRLFLTATVTLSTLIGCGAADAIREALDPVIQELQKVRLQLADEPEQWRQIMLNIQDDIPALSAEIKALASELVGRGIQAAQIHALQGMAQANDFYVRRMQQTIDELIDARLREIGLTPPQREPLPPVLTGFQSPQLTNVISVNEYNNGRLTTMMAFGYDMDHTTRAGQSMKLFHVSTDASPVLTDVSAALTLTHHYECTMNLLAVNSIAPLTAAKELRLAWGELGLGAVAVIQLQRVEYEHTEVGRQFSYVPPKTRGDADFDGNGPHVFATATLRVENNRVEIRLFMRAREWDSNNNEPEPDYTTAEGSSPYLTVYSPPAGHNIVGIVTDRHSSFTYVDSDHSADDFPGGGGELVQNWLFVGDTSGDDAGTSTRVTVFLNDVRILLERFQ